MCLFRQVLQGIAALLIFILLAAFAGLEGGSYGTMIFSFLSIAVLMPLFALLSWFGYAAFFLVAILCAATIGFRIYFGEHISLAILQSVAESKTEDSLPVLYNLIIPLGKWIILVLIFLMACFYLYRNNTSKRSRLGLFLVLLFGVSAAFYKTLYCDYKNMLENDPRFVQDLKESRPIRLSFLFRERSTIFYGDISLIIAKYLGENKYANIHIKKKLSPYIIGQNSNHQKDLIVFVMGESSLATHYSAYGYSFKTTPNIEKNFNNSEFSCIVPNVHSSAPITRDAVAMSLSFFVPEQESLLFQEKSIIDLAQLNGYKSYWISTSSISGLHAYKYGFLGQKSNFITNTNGNDLKTVAWLRNILKEPEVGKFIFIHLHGSHLPYKNYDEQEKKLELSDYDRTIHYTDRILDKIKSTLDENHKRYTLLYSSDHGEIIGMGHGIQFAGPEQYLIPLMITANYKHHYCHLIERLRNKNGYVSTLITKFVLAKTLGYQLNMAMVQKEVDNDRVLHSDGKVYAFSNIPKQGKLNQIEGH